MTFEEWWNNNAKEINRRYADSTLHDFIWSAAYLAGVQAERDRCYKIAEELDIEPGTCNEYGELTRKYDSWVNGVKDACSQIAAVIRGK